VQRGRTRAELGQTSAGWQDLEAAEGLGANAQTAQLRDLLAGRTLTEAEANLAAGQPDAALERLQKLERRGDSHQEVRRLMQVAIKLQAANRLARKGQFATAEAELVSAEELRSDLPWLARQRAEMRKREEEFRALRGELHAALTLQRWPDVVNVAERLLEMSPDDEIAADARSKAWAAAGMNLKPSPNRGPLARTLAYAGAVAAERKNFAKAGEARVASYDPVSRFLLWIDGVGGYLVCEGEEVVLGQPVAGSRVDVPILGDLSRSHATIRRSGEGHLIVPRRTTRLEGREIEETTALADGATLELGRGVKLRFRRPNALSCTARLDFISRHRTEPACDGVILMADSCIVGPAASSHIACPEWRQPLVLFRRNDESGSDRLYCKLDGEYQIDGEPGNGARPLRRDSRIMNEDFSIKLEEL
jgi:hypothetical protein